MLVAVDRAVLSQILMEDKGAMADLEAIVHPLVSEDRTQFLALHASRHTPLVCFDIPLLFEKNLQQVRYCVSIAKTRAHTQAQFVSQMSHTCTKKCQKIPSLLVCSY
jgi:dephospho-CoA kinase